MDPDVDVGRLEQMTEVVIGDPLNSKTPAFNTSENADKSMIDSIVNSGKNFASSVMNAVKGDTISEDESLDNDLTSEKLQYIFRVHPLCTDDNIKGPLEALLPGPCMEKLFHFSRVQQNTIFGKITRLQNGDTITSSNKSNQDGSTEKVLGQLSAYIRITNLNTTSGVQENYYYSDKRCIYLSNNLRSLLQLEVGSRVILSDFKPRIHFADIERIDLLPYYVSSSNNALTCHSLVFYFFIFLFILFLQALNCFDLGKYFTQYVDQFPTGLLLNNNMILTIPSEKGYIDAEVRLHPATLDHFLALPGSIDERKIQVLLEKRAEKQVKLPSVKPFIPKNISGDFHLM